MPRKPKTFNLYRKTRKQINDAARRREKKRGYKFTSSVWRAIRAEQLGNEPLCRLCAERDRVTPANVVDHIDGNPRNNDPSNLQSLCRPCHSRVTVLHDGGFGNPVDRRHS